VVLPRLGGEVPLEDKTDLLAQPRAGESDVTIGVFAIRGIGGPIRVMLCVRVVLLKQVDRLFSRLSVVVGWPGEVFVRSVRRDAEEVVPLHHSS
jgi:hypothetical protein